MKRALYKYQGQDIEFILKQPWILPSWLISQFGAVLKTQFEGHPFKSITLNMTSLTQKNQSSTTLASTAAWVFIQQCLLAALLYLKQNHMSVVSFMQVLTSIDWYLFYCYVFLLSSWVP